MRQVSFDPSVMKLLGIVMSEIEAEYHTIDASMREAIAARIMTLASEGETDPARLREAGLEALDRYAPREKKVAND